LIVDQVAQHISFVHHVSKVEAASSAQIYVQLEQLITMHKIIFTTNLERAVQATYPPQYRQCVNKNQISDQH
jgi:hypothetical protein